MATMTAYDVTVPLFVGGLSSLKGMLTKGEAHATATARDAAALLGAQLAGDMYNLATEVHWATEGAKLALERLLGDTLPPKAADAKSFAELHVQIDAALAYLAAVDAEALEAGLDRSIELRHRGGAKALRGDRFLTEFAISNFYFHLTAVYSILRHEGVPLQKGDFMSP